MLKGIYPIIAATFDENGALDYESFENLFPRPSDLSGDGDGIYPAVGSVVFIGGKKQSGTFRQTQSVGF